MSAVPSRLDLIPAPAFASEAELSMSLNLALLLAGSAMRKAVGDRVRAGQVPLADCDVYTRAGRLFAQVHFRDGRALLIPLDVWPAGARP